MKLKDLMEKYGEYTVPQELIEKLEPPQPKSVWDLKKGDNHCWVDITGAVCIEVAWRDDEEDKLSREAGNVFLTEEEAEKEIERRKVETLLLKHGGRRWFKCDIENWAIRYNYITGSFECGYSKCAKHQGCIYFDTKEEAMKAVNEIGKERIKEALFEVRE